MYIKDGIVYGEDALGIMVQSVKVLEDMIMIITFTNGETRLFDATVLDGPVFEPLQDEKVFTDVRIRHGVVTWANETIDCAPEFMYEHSYEYTSPRDAVGNGIIGYAEQPQIKVFKSED